MIEFIWNTWEALLLGKGIWILDIVALLCLLLYVYVFKSYELPTKQHAVMGTLLYFVTVSVVFLYIVFLPVTLLATLAVYLVYATLHEASKM